MQPQLKVCDLAAALDRMGGDVALLEKIAEFVREDSPHFLARLKTAIAGNDPAGVQHAAHSLKGLVANFDAEAAWSAAQKLEEMGRLGRLVEADEPVRDLDGAISELLATLSAELPKLAQGAQQSSATRARRK